MTRTDYTAPNFVDVPNPASPPAGAVALDAVHLNAMANAISNSARQVMVDVRDYGATGNGTTNDTAALQAAINASTGKTLVFPPGTYLVTQLLLPSDTHLELGTATIVRSGANTSGSAGGGTIRNSDQVNGNTNISVRGGTITGTSGASGRPWAMAGVDGLRLEGVTISKGTAAFTDFNCYFERCKHVFVSGLQITGSSAVGEDGLHIKSSQDMTVTNCVIDCGDDALVLVHEFNQVAPIQNITISNCTLASRSAHLIRVSVYPTESQPIQDVVISNIVGHAPAGSSPAGTPVIVEDQTNTGLLRRLTMDNITINATGYPGNAVTITNTADSVFSNWRISGAANRSVVVSNGQRLTFNDVIADTPTTPTGNPQWTITGSSSQIHHIGCQVRGSSIWGWVIDSGSDMSFTNCQAIGNSQNVWQLTAVARLSIIGCTTNGGPAPINCDTTTPPSALTVIGNTFAGYSSTGGVAVANMPAGTTYVGNSDLAGKPAVTGSRAGNAALASLLTKLAAAGLVTDTTTA